MDSASAPNTQTPKCTHSAEGAAEFTKHYCATFREVAATLEQTIPLDLGKAVDRAMMHWPEFKDLYGMGPDATLL